MDYYVVIYETEDGELHADIAHSGKDQDKENFRTLKDMLREGWQIAHGPVSFYTAAILSVRLERIESDKQ